MGFFKSEFAKAYTVHTVMAEVKAKLKEDKQLKEEQNKNTVKGDKG